MNDTPEERVYRLVQTEKFEKALRKLDRPTQRRILVKLYGLTRLEDPTAQCKAMTGPLTGLWRLRTGDYRTILDIRRGEVTIIALDTGHRSSVYEG
ncbi:MAG: type II toxin-antitoxin system RelE/ParE family toxin [Aeromicrobium sp.]|uniref:type II toxin-antitoxin system RelE family toxin n=1 Tax=Aeromicrobium sp. TaxID=1871063 RepID=UPI0039E46FA6